jgi:hypothetical protein
MAATTPASLAWLPPSRYLWRRLGDRGRLHYLDLYEAMFFFSNKFGCVTSLLISLGGTLLILILFGWIHR